MRATKTLPKITIQKDYSFYISTDDTLHPEGLELETCELIAFNTGDFVKVKTKELGHSLSLDNHRFQSPFNVSPLNFQDRFQMHAPQSMSEGPFNPLKITRIFEYPDYRCELAV